MKTLTLLSVAASCVLFFSTQTAYAKNWNDLDCGDNWQPTKSRAPVYPKRAMQMAIEGFIEMSFTITADGQVEDVGVVESSKKVFIRSATRAVNSMEFRPCIQNGQPTRLTNVSVIYNFNLK